MSSITTYEPSQTISLADRAKENLKTNKWQILLPGPIGLAALAATVVFLVSNPFGWAFSAGLVGTGIAFATLNAISAIGYSIYNLLKEPAEFKNSFVEVDPRCTTESLIEAIQAQFGTKVAPPAQIEMTPPPQKKIETEAPVQKSAPPEPPKAKKAPVKRTLKSILKAPKKPTPLPDYEPASPRLLPPEPPKSKSLLDRIYEHPAKSALLLGGLLLGGYGIYNYLTTAAAATYQALLGAPAATLALPAPAVLPELPMPASYLAVATIPSAFKATHYICPSFMACAQPVPVPITVINSTLS